MRDQHTNKLQQAPFQAKQLFLVSSFSTCPTSPRRWQIVSSLKSVPCILKQTDKKDTHGAGCPDDIPRKVTVLLYCNHGWSSAVGGELRVWEPFDQGGMEARIQSAVLLI